MCDVWNMKILRRCHCFMLLMIFIVQTSECQSIMGVNITLCYITAVFIPLDFIDISCFFEVELFKANIDIFTSFFRLYYDDWIPLFRPIIHKSKSYLTSVCPFHYSISIFNALISETIVLTRRSYLSAVGPLHHHGRNIDRISLEFLNGRSRKYRNN